MTIFRNFAVMSTKRIDIPALLVILAAIAFGALFFTMPRTNDDYWYMRGLKDFGTMADGSFDYIRGVVGTMLDHHHNDNSRIPNMAGAVLVSLPLWLLAMVSTVCVWLTFRFMTDLSAKKSILSVTFLITIYTYVIPWTDYLFSGMFTYNYIWPGALLTGAIWLFEREKSTASGWMFVMGLILGAWHEVFSFPAFVGAIICFIFHPRMLRRHRVWMCVGLLLGGLWLWLSPSRHSSTGFASYIVFHRPWRQMIDVYWFPFLFLFFELVSLCVPKWRKSALSPVAIFAVTFAVVCLPVYIFSAALRSITPAIIMSSVGIMYLIGRNLPSPGRWIGWPCAAVWLFFFLHMGTAFATGLKICHEEKYIISEYLKSKDTDGVVFVDPLTPADAPALSLGKPFQGLYTFYSHSALVGKYFHGPWMRVVPSALKDFSAEKGHHIDADFDLWEYDGHLVARGLEIDLTDPRLNAKVVYNNRKEVYRPLAYPFTGSDSCGYVYLNAPDDGLVSIELFNDGH